jgi:hypothetical protein
MTIIMLVDKEENFEKVLNRIKKEDILPVALDFESKTNLKDKNIHFRSLDEFMGSDTHLRSLQWLKDWSEKEISRDTCFKDLATYKGISLWWFADFWLYFHSVHKDSVYEITLYLDAVKNIIEQENPTKIILSKNNPLLTKITKLVAKEKNIQVEGKTNIKKNITYKLPYLIEKVKEKKYLMRKFYSKRIPKLDKERDLLFFTYSFNWEDGKDRFLGGITENLHDYNLKLVDIDYTPTVGLKETLNRKNTHLPFEAYYTKKIREKVLKQKKEFKKIWKELENNEVFKKSLEFEGTNLYPILKDKLKFIFTNRYPEAIKYIETASKLLSATNPKAIVLTDETSMYCRAVIAAARIKKITSIGVMHGMSNETAFEYMHNKEEVDLENLKCCPIPDHTLVFGEYTKELLAKKGRYPEESIGVVGQPRYDFITKPLKNNKEDIFNKLKLDKNKKLVTFYSECLSDIEAGDLPYAIFKAIKGLDINFVVKLHPREHELHQKFYEELAKKEGVNTTVIKDINVFELINASDVGIVMHSNTGMETVMLKKPLLVVNVTKKEDIFPYVKEGIALGAYTQEEIAPKIKELLSNQETKDRLMANRDRFISHRLFRLDGKSGERAREFIEKTIK